MPSKLPLFFDHSRHKLKIYDLKTPIDVVAFNGIERLSEPFTYTIEFTSSDHDIAAEQVLGKSAAFALHAEAPPHSPRSIVPAVAQPPLRTLHGLITAFRRLSDSVDETRYEVIVRPRLALLDKGKHFRIFQKQSVPEIVKEVLKKHHDFDAYEFNLDQLAREYPVRDQVMQYDESDLAFISRLLAEVGIWYRISNHAKVQVEVVEFHDDQRYYQFDINLPYRPQSGLNSSGEDGVWDLQVSHQVVEKNISFRAYQYHKAREWLDGEVDQTRGAKTTYGEAYHYAEPYAILGHTIKQDEFLESESGFFYARLRHERYLNDQTRLSGVTSSATLGLAQVLSVKDGAPLAFKPGAVIVELISQASRSSPFQASFTAIPYSETVCFRPAVVPKPKIAGTVPARITSPEPNDLYAEIDMQGRYRVRFLFDRDQWEKGRTSMWLRLARPYAGDTYGLHLPLICGTEVAVAFENGDPDRPYIAHALHDSEHPDPITLARRDDSRNVLRTPANNKLRLEDKRGEEHVKLSTEYGGKSQLNLGHLVNAEKKKRGEGFELRTDGWGAIRGGKGVLISADEQARAQGQALDMTPATHLIEGANAQMAAWQTVAQAHHSHEPALDGLRQLQADAKDLHAPAILLSAPSGIAAVTPASLLLNSGKALYLQSQDDIHLAAAQRLSAQANQAISLLAQQEGMRLVSGKGPLEIESHGDLLNLIAQQDITVQSVQGHLQLTAKNGITLASGGGYIRITPSGEIQIHGPGLVSIKGRHRIEGPQGQAIPLPALPGSVCETCLKNARAENQLVPSRKT